jgi:hypothetical protein
MTDTERIDWLERMDDEGACPAVLSDDNGHWAVSFEGVQNCPDGCEPEDIHTTFFIKAKCWKDTIREAIDAAMKDDGK